MNLAASFLTALLVVVPGLGATVAAFGPGRIGVATRLALTLALGYVVAGAIAFVLTVARVLSPASFFAFLAIVTGALWYVGLRRAGPAEHVAALRAEVRADPWPIALGLVVVAGMAIVAFGFSPLLNLSPSTSWRYWVDARELADSGRIPVASLQYGMVLPPTVSKIFLNAFDAAVIYTVGADPLRSLGPLAWLSAIGVVASLWAFGRELGLRLTAPLLPLLAVANRLILYKEPSVDLHTFKAENVGRMLVFAGAALAVRAFHDRLSWREPVLAGVVFGAAAGTHLVPVVVGAVLLGWYLLVRLFLDRGRVDLLKRAALAVGAAGVVAGAILFLPGGDIGFQGSAGNQAYARFGPNFDPTRYLSAGRVEQSPHRYTGSFYLAPRNIGRSFVVRATGVDPASRLGRRAFLPLEYLLAMGGLAAAIAMLLWFPHPLKPIGLMAWGSGVSLIVGALYFSYRYDLYILAWFGVRRLYDYSALPLILMALGLIEGGLWLAGKRVGRREATAGALALGLAGAAIFLPTAQVPSSNVPENLQRLEALDWIREHTPCDARILATQRTTGIFQATTGRVAVIEGMAPYLRPEILSTVVDLMLRARAFLEEPAQNQNFLSDQGIDYVVVLRGLPLGFSSPLGDPDLNGIAASPGLTMVHDGPQAVIFSVEGPTTPARTFVDPAGVPGYECRSGSVLGSG